MKAKKLDLKFFKENYPRLYSEAYGVAIRHFYFSPLKVTDAEDIAQNTILKLWQNREKYKPGKDVESLVRSIAKRESIDHYRRQEHLNLHGRLNFDYEAFKWMVQKNNPGENASKKEENILLERATTQLPYSGREFVRLHYLEGLSLRDIAKMKKTTKGAMNYQNELVLQELREKILQKRV
jgi:RNA polymerase sigma factor (sigma-70 family)